MKIGDDDYDIDNDREEGGTDFTCNHLRSGMRKRMFSC